MVIRSVLRDLLGLKVVLAWLIAMLLLTHSEVASILSTIAFILAAGKVLETKVGDWLYLKSEELFDLLKIE